MSTVIDGSMANAAIVVPKTTCVEMSRPKMNCLFALSNIGLFLTSNDTMVKPTVVLGLVVVAV